VQASNIPAKFALAFASAAGAGFTRPVPTIPTGTVGQASLQTGFPPANFNPVAAGGVPPFGQDFNGLFNQVTAWNQWVSAGGGAPTFDGTFSTSIGGYPNGAFLSALNNPGHFWISLVDNNTVNPDSGYSPQWQAFPNALLAPQTFFVNGTTGSDTLYDGTSATVSGSHGPWATIQKALNVTTTFNQNGFDITINVANGTYTGFTATKINGSGRILLIGNTTTPTSCLVAGLNQSAMIINNAGGIYIIRGFSVSSTGTNAADTMSGVVAAGNSTTVFLGEMNFGQVEGSQMTSSFGALLGNFQPAAPWTINGGATGAGPAAPGCFLTVEAGGQFINNSLGGPAISVTTSVSYAGSFVFATGFANMEFNYSSLSGAGSVTGQRFNVSNLSEIATGTSNVNYFPGTVAGSASSATFGLYT
jgi:hypothetical protein